MVYGKYEPLRRGEQIILLFLFMQYECFIGFECNVFSVICVFHIGNETGGAHKFFREDKRCLFVRKAAYYKQFFESDWTI